MSEGPEAVPGEVASRGSDKGKVAGGCATSAVAATAKGASGGRVVAGR
jgi:hypothetical protein